MAPAPLERAFNRQKALNLQALENSYEILTTDPYKPTYIRNVLLDLSSYQEFHTKYAPNDLPYNILMLYKQQQPLRDLPSRPSAI